MELDKDSRAHLSSRAKYLREIPGVGERKNCLFIVIFTKKTGRYDCFLPIFWCFLTFFNWKEPNKDARAYGSSRAKYLHEIQGVTERKKLFFPSDFSRKRAFLAVFCPFFGVF